MSDQVILHGPGEGRTLPGSDYITYKIRSDETERAYRCSQVSATQGFGPPPHSQAYRELFYVLDGSYEFTLLENGQTRTIPDSRSQTRRWRSTRRTRLISRAHPISRAPLLTCAGTLCQARGPGLLG